MATNKKQASKFEKQVKNEVWHKLKKDTKHMNHKEMQHITKIRKNTKKKNINITQMMVGKQRVKRWGMCRWAGEASIQVTEASSNNGYEAEGKAF